MHRDVMGHVPQSFGQFVQRGVRLASHLLAQPLRGWTDKHPRAAGTVAGSVSALRSPGAQPALERA